MRKLPESIQEIIKAGKPVPTHTLIKFRGVGRKVIEHLRSRGLVEEPEYEYDGLSARASHVLERLQLNTKEDTRRAILEGRLAVENGAYQGARCYGWKTHVEVCRWVGLPAPVKARTVLVCPHCAKHVPYSSQRIKIVS